MNEKKALISALLAVLLWSSVASAFKLTLGYFTPVVLLFYSSLFSIVALFCIILSQKKIYLFFVTPFKIYLKLFLLGLINPFLYYLVLFKAYSLLPAQIAQPINYTWALTLAYLSIFILKQRLSIYDIVSGMVCYFGVLIISFGGKLGGFEDVSLEGVLLALFSTLLWAVYWIYSKKSIVDPVLGLFINFISGFIAISVLIYIKGYSLEFDVEGILGSIYIGFFEMGLTFVLWLRALKLTNNSSKVANLIFLSPFISLIFIHYFLGEEIFLTTFIGLIFVIVGLLLQQKKPKLIKNGV